MLEVLLKGFGIGIAIAAPVGPIGVLCIRRSLVDGRAAGLATGLGAATADGLYGLLVATGFSVTGILIAWAVPLQIGGGLLIALLGIQAISSFLRRRDNVTPDGRAGPYRGVFAAYTTTFFLTLSNPMTILAFVGMVAALGTAASGVPGAAYWLVLGVFSGSAMWWLFLVQFSLMARNRLSLQATHWLDLGAGLLLLCWGIWIAVAGLAA